MTVPRLLLAQWRRRPGRAVATMAGVAVAVAAVVATGTAATASRAGYRRLAETVEGVPSLDVSARGGGRFDAGLVPRLVDVPGVRAVVPLFFRPTLLRVGDRRVREIAVGVDAAALAAAGLLRLTAGRACEGPGEIVLAESLARAIERDVGDEVVMLARRGIRRMQVVGLAADESLRWFAEGGGAIVAIEALADMSGALGLVDRVRVAVAPRAPRGRVLAAVASRLPAGLIAEVPAGRAGMAEDVMHAANLGLDFATGLTVAMAWFIVGNAMFMNVTERRRSFAVVRLLGATARQVRRFVALEAAILGTVGGAVGAVAGLAAARPVSTAISRALDAPVTPLVIHPLVIPAAVALGAAVAVAAAIVPARAAGDVDPLEGLADAVPPPRGITRRFLAAAFVLWLAAGIVMGLVVLGRLPPRAAVPAGILMMLAFVAMTPVVLPPLVRACGRLVPGRWRLERALAVEQIVRQPTRTALTTGVLVVAVSNGIGLGHAIRDNVEDVLGWYERLVRADWVLTRAGALSGGRHEGGPQSRALEEEVAALPGTARVEGIGIVPGRAAGGPCVVVARELPAGGDLPVEPVGVPAATVRQALERGEAVAGTMLARRAGIAPGAEIDVEVFGRTRRVRVAALAVDYTSGGSSLVLARDTARSLFGIEAADVLLVVAAPGRAVALEPALRRIARRDGLLLKSVADVRATVAGVVGGVVNSLWGVLGLGFVVGSLGVANTVTMSVLEKTRTLGLLRAVGMTGRQVRLLVVLESILVGAAGGLVGMLGGICTAALIQLSSQPLLGHPVRPSFRPGVIVLNLAAALVVSAVAAWAPARRAARLDLLEAVSAE